ncbi:MAG: AmmeMemoRadiSam system radical SAM enzyme [Deltaproteobacteria bacterium]|nr:AmmeMemoRadiSam system radical SAM enzyme [Deltaproteobacteria bacterium]
MKKILEFPTVKEAILYEPLKGGKVRCGLCERRCVISPNKRGLCKTRMNIDGRLYTLVYGDISAIDSRPIEIKPFFHFYPGSTALTISTWSCNLKCPWCQNWHLSYRVPEPNNAKYIPPRDMVDEAIRRKDKGICISFQEPTLLFEYTIDLFRLAKEKNLYNTYVSNGYMTIDALRMLKEAGMDAINIDIKGDKEAYYNYLGGAKEEIIWRNAHVAKEMGMHVEMIHLVVTGINDNKMKIEGLIKKHLDILGPETPLHFTRYFPAYRYFNPPTPTDILEFAYKEARRQGIYYPYIGNIPGHPFENTYCPYCGTLLIERVGYRITRWEIKGKNCPHCKKEVHLTP